MPGIAGIIGAKPGVEGVRIVSAMLDALQHEPFYATGRLSAPELGVYAGWTAHPQSRAAEASAEKTAPHLSWMMAGECVGDGPSALARYQQTGSAFVRDLNGIFSGLLVDRRKRQILLCNDRYGLERIYFHEAADGLLYFASEAKALLRVLPSTRAFDDEAIAQYLAFGCTHGVRSLFRGVGLLDGGTLWSFGEEGSRRERYITPATLEQQSPLDEEDFTEAFAAAFKAALPRYVGEGRELGISLTGGLDTRMIMACLPATTTRPVTYTFSGTQERTLDERIAAKVAATCGLEHRVLRIDHDFLANYGAFVDKTVLVTDGCFGATGAHEVYLNAKARELAPIRLTGNFGSEILRSMSTFKPLALTPELFSPEYAPLIAASGRTSPGSTAHPVTFSAFREIPSSLFGSLAAGRSQVIFRTPYLDNDIVSLAYRAPIRARTSPDAALHLIGRAHPPLGRIPTDRGLIAGASGWSGVLRRLFAEVTFKLDYLHKEGMPHRLSGLDPVIDRLSHLGVLGLHKYLPYRRWFRKEASGYVNDVLTDPGTLRMPYWRKGSVATIAADHIGGRRNYVREINAVLTLEAADRLLVRGCAS